MDRRQPVAAAAAEGELITTLLATSTFAGILPLLIVLACPLMMIFMMRGMHGGHGRAHGTDHANDHAGKSLDELKSERDQLNEEIGRRAEQGVAR